MLAIESLLAGAGSVASPAVVERALELSRSSRPTDRDRFSPGHFTASGFVVSPDGSSLLLIHHRRLDRWLQPGGHIDPEDTSPIAAAAREVAEETGVVVEPILTDLIDLDIHPIPPRSPEPAHEHFDLRFAFRALGDALVADDEVHDAIWVPWDDLASYAVDRSVTRATAVLRRECS
ncbi:MAG: NUDIX domain-containing protein [Actinomycetota bacterium]|nr:NUDIX domain-containing protein [Actinomycetota bacterium]